MNVMQAAFVDVRKRVLTLCTPAALPSEQLTAASMHSTLMLLIDALQIAQARAVLCSNELSDMNTFISATLLPTCQQKLSHLRATFMDPTISALLDEKRKTIDEMERTFARREQQLLADSFHADSVTGRKLAAKCAALVKENQGWGEQLQASTLELRTRNRALEVELAQARTYSSMLDLTLKESTEYSEELEAAQTEAEERIRAVQQELQRERREREADQAELRKLREIFKAQQHEQQLRHDPSLPPAPPTTGLAESDTSEVPMDT